MRVLKWIPLWLLLAMIIGTSTGRRCWDYYRLSKRGAGIQGIADAPEPHGQRAYSFTLNGQIYAGIGRVDASVTSVGDPVLLVYLPEDPAVNCLGDPRELYLNDLPLVIVVSLLFPTFDRDCTSIGEEGDNEK